MATEFDTPTVKPQKIAVALENNFETEKQEVTASATGRLANVMIDIAHANGIPIHNDEDLAQLLIAQKPGPVLDPLARELVAEVLSFLYQVDSQTK